MVQKTALVIGGTSGLGRQIAINLLSRGIQPVILGRSVQDANKDPELEGAAFVYCDLVAVAERFEGPWDHLASIIGDPQREVIQVYWVAGVVQGEPLVEMDDDAVADLMAVHVLGPTVLIQHILVEMIANEQPFHMVTVSSTSGHRFRAGEEVYCASKAYKNSLTVQLVGSLATNLPGSRVTLVMPGGMDTPFWDGEDADATNFMNPAEVARIVCDQVNGDKEHAAYDNTGFASLLINRGPSGDPEISDELPGLERPKLL